jgi:hypothetical protein
MLGARTLTVIHPLLAYGLTNSVTVAGWVLCAAALPGLLCYLPAGAVVDRLGVVGVLIISDTCRALLLMVLCVTVATDALSIGGLLMLVFVDGCLSSSSSVAQHTHVMMAAQTGPRSRLAWHEMTVHIVALIGRPLGGALQALSPMLSLMFTTFCFAVAAAILPGQPAPARMAEPQRSLRRAMVAGFRELGRHGHLRSATLVIAVTNVLIQALLAISILHCTATGMDAAVIGVMVAAGGVGGLLGALSCTRWRRRTVPDLRCPGTAGTLDHERRRAGARERAWPAAAGPGHVTLLLHTWTCATALALAAVSGMSPVVVVAGHLLIGVTGAGQRRPHNGLRCRSQCGDRPHRQRLPGAQREQRRARATTRCRAV